MTPDRQQLKEALEVFKSDPSDNLPAGKYLDKYKEWPDVIIRQAAQAWYDLPDRLEGMRKSTKMIGILISNYDYEDVGLINGHNTAIDEIKEMVKPSPE